MLFHSFVLLVTKGLLLGQLLLYSLAAPRQYPEWGNAESQEFYIGPYGTVIHHMLECLTAPSSVFEEKPNDYAVMSAEKKKSLLKMKRETDPDEILSNSLEETTDVQLTENQLNLFLEHISCAKFSEMAYSEQSSFELSSSEELSVGIFMRCIRKIPGIFDFEPELDDEVGVVEAKVKSHMLRMKRSVEDEGFSYEEVQELMPYVEGMYTCAVVSKMRPEDFGSFESDSSESDGSNSLSNEIEPENIVKRQMNNELTSSEEEALLFYECLSLRPDIIVVVERIWAKNGEVLEGNFQSRLVRIVRQTSSDDSFEMTDEEMEGLISVLECAGVDVEELFNEVNDSAAKRFSY